MKLESVRTLETHDVAHGRLRVYLLPTLEFDIALALQRRLMYEVSEDRDQAALILCQHSPLITVGRQGSFRHILCGPEEMRSRRWQVRWVNRGGGCLLHVPGQLCIYPILALDRLGLGLGSYLRRMQEVMVAVLGDFTVRAAPEARPVGIRVGQRLIAGIGVAVCDWVTYHGAFLNINPALEPFRLLHGGGPAEPPMTSLERERRAPLSTSLVRQRFLEHFAARFGFGQLHLFTDHPALSSSRKTSNLCCPCP